MDGNDNGVLDDWSVDRGFIGHFRVPFVDYSCLNFPSRKEPLLESTTLTSTPIDTCTCSEYSMLSALRRSYLPLRISRTRLYATVSNPQTLVEKIVQNYAVDLAPGTKVHSGDYVMIKPEHV